MGIVTVDSGGTLYGGRKNVGIDPNLSEGDEGS